MERNEAIERIKSRFDYWALDNGDKTALECLIPELKESEDERIRKTLIDHFTEYESCAYDGTPAKEILAWLEKQKEEPHLGLKSLKYRCMTQPNQEWNETCRIKSTRLKKALHRRYSWIEFLNMFSFHISIKWWKELCEEKNEIAYLLGMYKTE